MRIARAVREAGMESVAIFSEADAGAMHVRCADRRIGLPGSAAKETYLHHDRVIAAAIQSGADAVHPGYGFCAENAAFARAVIAAGLIFIGPSPEAIELMGDKDRARKQAMRSDVPVVPGTDAGIDLDQAAAFGRTHGYPLMVKAVAGGSGRGMRVVERADELPRLFAEAQSEGHAVFGNGTVIIEKLVPKPRHVEVQVFGDSQGTVLHLGERDCSTQRRQQKIIEEAPAPNLHPHVRERMADAAVRLACSVGYCGAGTMEFLVEGGERPDAPFYFLEMNTRIQVEHPVTEAVTGLDLVRWQLDVARGRPLPAAQHDIIMRGHAVEFRVYAEDPQQGFKPASGEVRWISRPTGPGVREDGWAEPGTRISPHYDTLITKLIIWGNDRAEALARARAVLDGYSIDGMPTTLGFHRWLLRCPEFLAGALDVKWIDREYEGTVRHAAGVGPLVVPAPPQGTEQ